MRTGMWELLFRASGTGLWGWQPHSVMGLWSLASWCHADRRNHRKVMNSNDRMDLCACWMEKVVCVDERAFSAVHGSGKRDRNATFN